MSFPLGDWIDAHQGLAHNLALSGMMAGLRTVPRALRRPRAPDGIALRRELAHTHGVAPGRLFLTHGATEGNGLVLTYLHHVLRARAGRGPTVWTPRPEYPPLRDAAEMVGFRWRETPTHMVVLSEPNNPTGEARAPDEIPTLAEKCGAILVDETFREFSNARSWATRGIENLWTTGTFTKAYGGDAVRVGFVIAPEEAVEAFGRFHGAMVDGIPEASVSAARSLLAARRPILEEATSIFRSNLHVLQDAISGVPGLAAPVWFDRGEWRLPGDRFARALLRAQVLTCPGSYFGDPTGVRICLTQRSFPGDLRAYLGVRRRWV